MLNELAELSESLELAQIAPPNWHRHLKQCPEGSFTIRVLVGANAEVTDIESITDRENLRTLRKWEDAAGVSFPAFNLLPLYENRSDGAADVLRRVGAATKRAPNLDAIALLEQLRPLIQDGRPLWGEAELDRIGKCLKVGCERLSPHVEAVPNDVRGFRELCRRAGAIEPPVLRQRIEELLLEALRGASNSPVIKSLIGCLVFYTGKAPKKFQIVLELADRSSFEYPANHSRVHGWLNQRLLELERASHSEADAGTDAFGSTASGSSDKFPEVKLPRLGNVKLRAMSDESQCQRRYGRSESASFPVGGHVRLQMKSALEWLAASEREGRTWQNVSEACGYDKGCLYVYPSRVPHDPPELAELFGGEHSEDDSSDAKFEACAARVTPALHGIVKEHPDAEIRVFVLAKPDGFRTKVLVSRRYEAARLVEAAEEWQEGCANLPPVALNLGTNKKPHWVMPLTPFPVELVQCLNVTWLRAGQRAEPTRTVGMGEGISLLMERAQGQGTAPVVERALHLGLANAAPLLLALGHADHRRDGALKLPAQYAKHASLLPSILALLLFKRSILKGEYMHTAPFLVGRLLALSDTLHKEYCQRVRKKDVPPQLMGNATMSLAIERPAAGLARLAERMPIYQSWANTATGDGIGLAKWVLGQMADVSEELELLPLPNECDDVAKAQLLLGYLARAKSATPEGADSASAQQDEETPNAN